MDNKQIIQQVRAILKKHKTAITNLEEEAVAKNRAEKSPLGEFEDDEFRHREEGLDRYFDLVFESVVGGWEKETNQTFDWRWI